MRGSGDFAQNTAISTCLNAELKRAIIRYPAQRVVCMSLGLFIKALCLTSVLVSAASGSESPDDLIAKGDAFDQKFQATQALQFYLPAEKLAADQCPRARLHRTAVSLPPSGRQDTRGEAPPWRHRPELCAKGRCACPRKR